MRFPRTVSLAVAGLAALAVSSTVDARDFQLTDADRAYWAFQPIARPAVPTVRQEGWVTSPIDAFILGRLEAAGLTPSPPATPRELVRRVSFDLIGLPPTIGEVEAFERDPSLEAYGALVDRLLESPRYGERWGRHWLDVVRFAESNGYERDGEKPFAWRYRDYVIRAFNDDKPFDRFIREQLAGDELTDSTAESVVATGYYRLGVWDDEPDDARAAEYDALDDVVRTTGAAFLGLSIGCARCHNHMFDPIPQEDYYRFLSFFHNIRPYANAAYSLDSPTYAPLAAPAALAEWVAERDRRVAQLEARRETLSTAGDEDRKKLDEEIQAQRASAPPFEWALAVRERGAEPPATHVLVRGDAAHPGAEVEPQFLTILGGQEARIRAPPLRGAPPTSGRRAALADWIASPQNPLTARVLVNRLWQHHFGRGIVTTPNDFGRAGAPPTHPELLDWLASELIARGWRLKALHREILVSSAYRMSSRAGEGREAEVVADPANDLLWRQGLQRLEAEPLRDSLLAASGRLHLALGGPSFFPRLDAEVVAGLSRPGLGWGVSSPQERGRRSVYAFVKRTLRVPFLETFDLAPCDSPQGARAVTTVAPQALVLLNSDLLQEEALAFARRILAVAGDDQERQVEEGYELALSRRPRDEERRVALSLLERQAAALRALPPSLTFAPTAPSALEKGYLDRLPVGDLLAGPDAGWSYAKGSWVDKTEGIWWVDPARGPHALLDGEAFQDGALEAALTLARGALQCGVLVRGGRQGDIFEGYELCLDVEGGALALRRHDRSGVRELARRLAKVPLERPLTARVSIEGGRFAASIHGLDRSASLDGGGLGAVPGGELALEAMDPEPLARPGPIGIRVWGAPVTVTRLAVSQRAGADAPRPIPLPAPADTAELEALRAFALVLFNLNEFIYID